MSSRIAIVFLAAALAGCQNLEETIAEVTAPEIAGAWARQSAGEHTPVLVLDEEGGFGIVGEDTVGRWELDETELVLSVAKIPTSRVEKTRLPLVEVGERTLVIGGEGAFAGRYDRADDRIGHLDVTARYPEKIALPPDAVVTIELRDVSRADAPSELIAGIRAAGGGLTSPMRFHLHYLRGDIDPRMSYTVSARVEIGERVWMRTTTHVPVLTRGGTDEAELSLEGVPQAGARGLAGEGFPLSLALPATFAGRAATVTLWPDGTFRLREPGPGSDGEFTHDLGRWALHGDRLVLQGGAGAPRDYRLEVGGLQRVNPAGFPLGGSDGRLGLQSLDPVSGPMRLLGRVTYLADAARFEECLTGRGRPVAMEAAWIDVERAYLAAGASLESPLLAEVRARFVRRPRMEGAGDEEALVIEQFSQSWPGGPCRPERADAPLGNTWWRLMVVGDRWVRTPEDSPGRPPHLRLLGDGRATGSGGCNGFSGTYETRGAGIRFGTDMAATLMACREAVQAVERAFFGALGRAARYHISGDRLDLYAADGAHLAHLQATYFD